MSTSAHRQFYDFPDEQSKAVDDLPSEQDNSDLFGYLNKNIIGSKNVFSSPFGPRTITYCDYVASGRSVQFIEDYITSEVLPTYGSTHTSTSVTSLQTSLFRHEARDIMRNAVRASEHDRIIFTGSGATGAMHKLIQCLQLDQPPIVFVDCYAHHSSQLPWREIAAKVIRIKETVNGSLDLAYLQEQLSLHEHTPGQKIGCFTAASNITGIISHIDATTILLHKYHALAFWDYATAAPYIEITMNPILEDDAAGLAYKDALFFSLHKFVGGVQTPGVLVAKKEMFRNQVPTEGGGGTVFYVTKNSHRYLKDIEEREEGGTPPIVETIRGGMTMQLKVNLTPQRIMEKCHALSRKLSEFCKEVPELISLGNMEHENRLPILSFLVQHPETRLFLHHNLVAVLLNDLYGIQSRGGCACAGPYAHDLLGIDEELAQTIENALLENPQLDRSHLRRREEHGNLEVLRPGFTRIILPFSAPDEQISYILSAVKDICSHGWKLLPQYFMNTETGDWKHHTNLVFKNRQWLQNISYSGGVFNANLKNTPRDAPSYSKCLAEGLQIFEAASKASQRMQIADQSCLFVGQANAIRWFLLPHEAKNYLSGNKDFMAPPQTPPFIPATYPLTEAIHDKRNDCIWVNSKAVLKYPQTGTIPSVADKREQSSMQNGVSPTVEQKKELFVRPEPTPSDQLLTCSIRSKSTMLKLTHKAKWVAPPKKIFTATLGAIEQFKMITNGDKVLVCLSGGKDSLSLLHTLKQFQHYGASKNVKFDLGAVTVDPQSSSYDPRPLIPYLAALDVPYFFEEQGILKQALELTDLNSICSFCSRMKRGRLYAAARREGYNVLAFGQHLDDLAESFLMSVFHNGRLRTMKAAYTVREGDLRVIRPFVSVREKSLRQFAESKKLPIIPENCPACFEAPKERHRMKQLLAQEEVNFPQLFWSIRTAMLPLLSINQTGLENQLFGKLASLKLDNEPDEQSDH